MHRGCLATTASSSVIDSQQDLYITDRELKLGGQWCVSCFWPGVLCFEFSRSPCGLTQGWWEFESSVSDRFSPRQAMHAVVSFSFFSSTEGGGLGVRRKREDEPAKERVDVLKCDSCARNSWFLPPPKHPAAGSREAQLDRLWHQNSDMQQRVKWVTAEKQINSPERQDGLRAFFFSLLNLQLTLPTLTARIHFFWH